MSELKLGALIEDEQERDAIHIAVAPVTAGERLHPGEHIGFLKEDNKELVGYFAKTHLGVVDPYLKEDTIIELGQKFWMFLYPQTITSLRHDWTHPAFELAVKPKAVHEVDSEAWLTAHADRLDITYSALMKAAKRWLDYGDYTVQRDNEVWRDDFGPAKEFWHHYEIVTGTKVEDHEATFFCCSC